MGGRVDVDIVLDLIKADGFEQVRSNGSHHHFTKEGGPLVTVPYSQKGDFLPEGTAKSIARRAGAHIEEALKAVLNGTPLKKQVKALKAGVTL